MIRLRSEATARQAGGNLAALAEKIRGLPGVEQVVARLSDIALACDLVVMAEVPVTRYATGVR